MNETVIKVQSVGKTFKLPNEKQTSIKGLVVNFFNMKKGYEIQKALNNVSFEIKRGDFFGIVGRNGSGKSTLLKLIAGIYSPTDGTIDINGSLTPFIELGVGFSPELTGRENVYLNGALLGFNRKEMTAMYDEIVEFAELEKFMDQKLKNYSSGMQVRLAFSIAIRAKSDILLIDEVLAVGDESFSQKSLNVFDSIKKDKTKTVVFVSHDMQTVQKFCNRVIVIHDSKIKFIGDPNRAAIEYKKLNFPDMAQSVNTKTDISLDDGRLQKTSKVKIIKFDIIDHENTKDRIVSSGKPFSIKFTYKAEKNMNNIVFGVSIKNSKGDSIYGPNTEESNKPIRLKKGSGTIELHIADNIFTPGKYTLDAGIFNTDQTICYDYISIKEAITIVGIERHGYAYIEPEWTIK